MKTTTHIRRETESLDDLSTLVEGRVFHVTKLSNLVLILADGEIKPNGDGALPTTFGSSENSFFRKRNCVSLFDYRPEPTKEIKEFRMRCSPFKPARSCDDGIAILILRPEVYTALIPWTCCKESACSEMVVPYVEAGYPGAIPIGLIDEVVCVKIDEDPTSLSSKIRNVHLS